MEAQYTLDTSGTKSPAAEAISSVQGSASCDRSTEKLSGSRDSTSSRGSALQREAFAAQPSLGRFGQYDLKAILGSGGFGVVYHAWDAQLGRQVAVKVPRFDMTDERKARRFRQEARAVAKLQHPNIVVVFDEGTQDGKPYIVSEFVDGEPLSARIERNRPNLRLAVQWVRDLAVALDYAHDQGVVHRDIKPENIMLGKHGRPQIMDFGLAKQLDEDSSLSIDGSVMGTPNYMAPEQARGEISAVDGRSDQYSLGVILYELLTGTKPFSGPAHAVLAKVADRNHHPAPPRSIGPKIPRDLEAICLKSLSKESADRYPRLSELASDLDRWLTGKATKLRPLSRPDRLIRWCRNNRALAITSMTGILAALFAVLLSLSLIGRGAPSRHAESPAIAAPVVTLTQSERPNDVAVAASPVPLRAWLAGRKQLTVSQDGSAMFTSIQAALDAQTDGQVVHVLDRGPYRESILWRAKNNCGLITQGNTVVVVDSWNQVDAETEQKLGHRLIDLQDCRLHGFIFMFEASEPLARFPLHAYQVGGLCIESCIFGPNLISAVNVNAVVQVNPVFPTNGENSNIWVRECVFSTGFWFGNASNRGSLAFTQNLILMGPDPDQQNDWSHVKIIPNCGDSDFRVEVSKNVFIGSDNRTAATHFSNNGIGMEIDYSFNSLLAPTGPALFVEGVSGMACSIRNSLHLTPAHEVVFSGDSANFGPIAQRRWLIENNVSNSNAIASKNGLLLGPPTVREVRLLSTDPLDRNFLRVDPTTITVTPGKQFPGALPPGPAPTGGDWFNRLQGRWRETLSYLPEQDRVLWTQPIQLPKYQGWSTDTMVYQDQKILSRYDFSNLSFLELEANVGEPRKWVEVDAAGKRKFDFREAERDDQRVTVIDKSRNLMIRMPQQGGRAYLKTEENQWRFFGTTTSVLSNKEVSPRVVTINRDHYPDYVKAESQNPEFSERLDQLEKDLVSANESFFVFAKIKAEDPQEDLRRVVASRPVQSSGVFVGLEKELGQPIVFSLTGYEDANIALQGPDANGSKTFFEDLGEVHLKKLRHSNSAIARGQVFQATQAGNVVCSGARIHFRLVSNPGSNVDKGTPPSGVDDSVITVATDKNGDYIATGLLPGPAVYSYSIYKNGLVSIEPKVMTFKAGENLRLDDAVLQLPRKLKINYIAWDEQNQAWSDVMTDIVNTGERWLVKDATGKTGRHYYAEIQIGRLSNDEDLSFKPFYPEGKVKAVGPGEIADYSNIDIADALVDANLRRSVKLDDVLLVKLFPRNSLIVLAKVSLAP